MPDTRTRTQPLGEYNRRRDFDRTAEPAGAVARHATGPLCFVIQKHAASHLHFDLRLELDGVMKSWAVPKGPSLDPSVRRLAMQVEDHPISYNAFEGTIPRGEYGGGTVMLWDHGSYSADDTRSGEDDARAVRRGLRAGKLGFTLHGDRLRGAWTLVRTEPGRRAKWLLMKQRDETAVATTDIDITAEVMTSVATGRTMDEIAGDADRVWHSNRGGAQGGEQPPDRSAATTTDPLAPMQPTPARRLPDSGDWTFEPWHGGRRVLAYATPDAASLLNERAQDVTGRHPHLAEELSALARRTGHSFVLDGELNGAKAEATLHAADLLLIDDEPLHENEQLNRRDRLEELFRRRRLRHTRLLPVYADGARLLRRAVREGWSGIVARRTDAAYEPGVRSSAALRIAAR